MTENQEKAAIYKEEREKALERLKEINNKYFFYTVKDIFDKTPELKYFSFKQYTDYFNDGEECNFYVHSDSEQIEINGYQDWDITKDNYLDLTGLTEEEFESVSHKVSELLDSLGEELLESMFGDHAKVCVTSEGVEVLSYTDHD